jgi:hypothetical protein
MIAIRKMKEEITCQKSTAPKNCCIVFIVFFRISVQNYKISCICANFLVILQRKMKK